MVIATVLAAVIAAVTAVAVAVDIDVATGSGLKKRPPRQHSGWGDGPTPRGGWGVVCTRMTMEMGVYLSRTGMKAAGRAGLQVAASSAPQTIPLPPSPAPGLRFPSAVRPDRQ